MTKAAAVTSRACLVLAVAVAALLAMAALAEQRFVLSDGTAVPGETVQATRNTLTVRREIGGIRQIARSDLARVEVRTADGATVSGAFAGWQQGRMALRYGAELIWIDRDRLVDRDGSVTAASPPGAGRPASEAAASLARPAGFTHSESEPIDAAVVASPATPVLEVQTAPAVDRVPARWCSSWS